MTLSNTPGSIKKFARISWKFQATFATPLKELDSFVSAILEDGGYEAGTVTIDEITFEAKNLNRFLAAKSLSTELRHDSSIKAEDQKEVRELLKNALSDWIDFLFVPIPKPFVIYADHDEFATFYANTKSNLNCVVSTLVNQGFKQIPDYQREL